LPRDSAVAASAACGEAQAPQARSPPPLAPCAQTTFTI
jgi:hypothetical protein